MLIKKNKKVINVQTIEHDDLIKMIENMDGISVKRTAKGVQISIVEQVLTNSSVGIRIKKKNKGRKKIGHLTPIYGTEKMETSQFRQSSAIIAKSF